MDTLVNYSCVDRGHTHSDGRTEYCVWASPHTIPLQSSGVHQQGYVGTRSEEHHDHEVGSVDYGRCAFYTLHARVLGLLMDFRHAVHTLPVAVEVPIRVPRGIWLALVARTDPRRR